MNKSEFFVAGSKSVVIWGRGGGYRSRIYKGVRRHFQEWLICSPPWLRYHFPGCTHRYIKIYQIVSFKYVQFIVYQSDFNKVLKYANTVRGDREDDFFLLRGSTVWKAEIQKGAVSALLSASWHKELTQEEKSTTPISTLFRSANTFFHNHNFPVKKAVCWWTFWHQLLICLTYKEVPGLASVYRLILRAPSRSHSGMCWPL